MNATRIIDTMRLIEEFTQFKCGCIDILMAIDSSGIVKINNYIGTSKMTSKNDIGSDQIDVI